MVTRRLDSQRPQIPHPLTRLPRYHHGLIRLQVRRHLGPRDQLTRQGILQPPHVRQVRRHPPREADYVHHLRQGDQCVGFEDV